MVHNLQKYIGKTNNLRPSNATKPTIVLSFGQTVITENSMDLWQLVTERLGSRAELQDRKSTDKPKPCISQSHC